MTRWTDDVLSSCSGSPLRATGASRSHLGGHVHDSFGVRRRAANGAYKTYRSFTAVDTDSRKLRVLFASVSRPILALVAESYTEAACRPLMIGTTGAHQICDDMPRCNPHLQAIVLDVVEGAVVSVPEPPPETLLLQTGHR